MGASGWSYIVTFDGDAQLALDRLRERVFRDREYYWDTDDEAYLGPRRATLADLDALREEDRFWEVGTHSILDMDRIVASDDEDHDGTVRQLPPKEAAQYLGSATPTREQFQHAEDTIPDIRRWSGRYQLLYSDGAPEEIAFWGFSGD